MVQLCLSEFQSGETAPELLSRLQMLQGSDAVLGGASVARFDTPCIEVLLAARQSWAAAGLNIKIDEPSDGLVQSLELSGLSIGDIQIEGNEHAGNGTDGG